MVFIEYSGAGGKLIHEKNQKQKISWHCPFKMLMQLYLHTLSYVWVHNNSFGYYCLPPPPNKIPRNGSETIRFWRPDVHCSIQFWKGDENLRYRFATHWVVASILDFLVHKRYRLTLLWDENFFILIGRFGYKKIRLFIPISKKLILPV